MTVSTMILAGGGAPVEAVSAAIGEWCRRWPEKVLVRDFGVAIQTAKKWRRGEDMPAGRHLVAMADRWGQPFLDHAFAAVLDDTSLDGRLAALEASLALVRQDLRHDAENPAGPRPCGGARQAGRMARPCGPALATARSLIFGIMLGATVAHLVPRMPDTVADLVAAADDQMRPRAPKPKAGQRLVRIGPRSGKGLG